MKGGVGDAPFSPGANNFVRQVLIINRKYKTTKKPCPKSGNLDQEGFAMMFQDIGLEQMA